MTADPRQLWRAIERRGLGGTAALALSITACYGTLAAVAALSALGATFALDAGVWAGAIVLFTALAAVSVELGARTHGSAAPLAPAFAGGALIGYAMFGHYDRVLKLAGFALLAAAVFWDFRLRSRAKRESPGSAMSRAAPYSARTSVICACPRATRLRLGERVELGDVGVGPIAANIRERELAARELVDRDDLFELRAQHGRRGRVGDPRCRLYPLCRKPDR